MRLIAFVFDISPLLSFILACLFLSVFLSVSSVSATYMIFGVIMKLTTSFGWSFEILDKGKGERRSIYQLDGISVVSMISRL